MKMITSFVFYLFLSFLMLFNNFNLNIDSNSNKDYFFDISISKIDLSQKVYHFDDEKNNVDKGIYLVKDYNFDSMNGSLILASHSGNSSISYFKNLHLLSKKDLVTIVYNNISYYYEIMDIYKINKTGKFKYKDEDKTIYLITCDKKNDEKQLIFKGKLINISKKSTFL